MPKPKARRSSILNTVRQLSILEQTEQGRQIDRTLIAWSAYLLEINPSFRANLFRAIWDEWSMRVRGVLYEDSLEGSRDERDRACVTFNSQVLFGLQDASGESYSADWQPRVDADREEVDSYCRILSRRLAGEQVMATPEVGQPTIIDLNCWRQSHARPLNGGLHAETCES
jgi:hypothetical protein